MQFDCKSKKLIEDLIKYYTNALLNDQIDLFVCTLFVKILLEPFNFQNLLLKNFSFIY